jgi:hypothetical protein
MLSDKPEIALDQISAVLSFCRWPPEKRHALYPLHSFLGRCKKFSGKAHGRHSLNTPWKNL